MDVLVARLRRTAVAVFASAAVLFASVAPMLAGHLAADRECAPILAEHDHTAHRIQKAPGPEAEHCVACHVARAAHDGAAAKVLIHAGAGPASPAEPEEQSAFRHDSSTDFTRGPPSYQFQF